MKILKKSYVIVALVCTLAVAACGSNKGGGSTAQQLANAAIAALENITDNWSCTDNGHTVCDCPGGGQVVFSGIVDLGLSVSKSIETATVNNCRDLSGLAFNGEMDIDDDTGEGELEFDTFGECRNISGTFNLGSIDCEGTISGTCGGETLTCNLVDGPDDDCVCAD
jgi:hypothetical protein